MTPCGIEHFCGNGEGFIYFASLKVSFGMIKTPQTCLLAGIEQRGGLVRCLECPAWLPQANRTAELVCVHLG